MANILLKINSTSYSDIFHYLIIGILAGIIIHIVSSLIKTETYTIEDNYHIVMTKPHNPIKGIQSLIIIFCGFIAIIMVTTASVNLFDKSAHDYVKGIEVASKSMAYNNTDLSAINSVANDFSQIGGDMTNVFTDGGEEIKGTISRVNTKMSNELLYAIK